MIRKLYFILTFFYCGLPVATAVDLTEVDFKYLYDPNGIFSVDISNSCKGDSLQLFISINFKNKEKQGLLSSIGFIGQEKFNSKTDDILTPIKIKSDTLALSILVEAHVKTELRHNYIIVDLVALGKHYFYSIGINEASFFPCTSLTSYNLKRKRHITSLATIVGDSVKFDDVQGNVDEMFVYKYTSSFPSALPPMAGQKTLGSKSFEIDSIFMANNIAVGPVNSLYFIQSDSSGNAGVSLLTVSRRFPKIISVDDLIAPLIYVSTRSEFELLSTSTEKRKAFESFWLNRTAGQQQARRVIRDYYKNVQWANQLLTSYKIGWKTDQGMILTVYGAPVEVKRGKEWEEWIYYRSGEKLTYTFDKVPNLFSHFHYNLRRNKGYFKDWFKEVAKWRKGKI